MISLFKNSDKVTDPVCLMKVSKTNPSKSYKRKSQTYYFCSNTCLEDFKRDPLKYVN